MKPGSSLPRELGMILVDALTASLITAVAIEGTAAFTNDYVAAGLLHLPLLAINDTLTSLAAVALGLRIGVSVAVFTGAWCLKRELAPLLVLLGTGLACAGLAWAFRSQLLAVMMIPSVIDQYVNLIARGRIALVLLVLTTLILGGIAASGRSRFTRSGVVYSLAVIACVGLVIAGAHRVRASLDDEKIGRKNVILVVLDTVGATHLASYGYSRHTTPELDRLAERGVLYTQSYSVAPWTLPSHVSMFTGLHPIQHGATQEHLRVDDELHTLAEILRAEGYRTFAAINNPVIGIGVNSHQGFADFYPMWRRAVAAGYSKTGRHPTNAVIERFLDELGPDDRFFAFLNYIEAHGPYDPPAEMAVPFLPRGTSLAKALTIDQNWQQYYLGTNPLSEREFRVLNDLYDAELSLISRTIGDLVRGLETRSLLDDTLVIITSDHGENIGDHNHLDHVFSLHDSVLHVPLILLDPDVEVGRREDSLATSVDVFQTALAAARSEYTAERSTGRNLLAPSVSGTPRAHVAEYYYPEQVMSVFGNSLDERGMNRIRRYLRRIRSIQTDEWKLIWGSDGNHLLFDVRNDPGEALDLADDEPEQVVALTRLLEEQLGELRGGPFSLDEESIRIDEKASDGGGGFQDLDDEARERLKTLGYVE